MKVLHVITGLAAGGAETQLELLIRHSRHTSEVVALYNVGSVGRQISSRGIKVYDLGMRSNRQVHAVRRLARLMRRERYDVVHVHLYRACIYGRIAARMAGVPVVVTTEHSLGDTQIEGRPKTRAIRALYLATDRLSDVTAAVSPQVQERLIDWGVQKSKIRVIPNGLDFGRFAPDARERKSVREEFGIPPGEFVVGSVGRLHPGKRYDALIQAVGPVLARGARLLLVGEGQDRDRLQDLVRKTGYPHRVIFAGEREDVPRFLSAMDLFVSPSREETFGLTSLEAVSAGVRVAIAACPALEGVQADGIRRISGEVEELRAVLLEEYGNGTRANGTNAAFQRRYDIRSVAANLDELYECLLAGRAEASCG